MTTSTTNNNNKRKGTDEARHDKSSSSSYINKNKKSKVEQQHQQKLSSSVQRRMVKHERQSHRKHSNVVIEGKEIWNRLRLKNNTKDEQRILMDKLMNLISGSGSSSQGSSSQGPSNNMWYDIAQQHDASRIVQAAIQFSTMEQRKQIIHELCCNSSSSTTTTTTNTKNNNKTTTNNLMELCKIQYSHFVVLKMIKYCTPQKDYDDCITLICKQFKGHIPKLSTHIVGSRVVEFLFANFPSTSPEVQQLKNELYGPHYNLLVPSSSSSSTSFVSNMIKLNDEKKKKLVLDYMLLIINKCLEKQFYSFVYVHELIANYMDCHCSFVGVDNGDDQEKEEEDDDENNNNNNNSPPNEIRSNIISNIVDHAIHFLSTKAGTRIVIHCISYGTAHYRKRIMKSIKGYTRSSLLHHDAYLAVLRLIQVTDDTVTVSKSVLSELLLLTTEEEEENDNNDKKKKKSTTTTTSTDDDNDEQQQQQQQDHPLLEIALNEMGSKLFLILLVPTDNNNHDNNNDTVSSLLKINKYLNPYERKLLKPNPTILLKEKNGSVVQQPTSKKNSETRRIELLQTIQKSLFEMCNKHTLELVTSIYGSRVLKEVYNNALLLATTSSSSSGQQGGQLQELVNSIIRVCDDNNNNDCDASSIFEDQVGHLTIKHVILCDAEYLNNNKNKNGGDKDDELDDLCYFSKTFFHKYQTNLMSNIGLKSNRGSFVISALIKVKSSIQCEVINAVSQYKKQLLQKANDNDDDGSDDDVKGNNNKTNETNTTKKMKKQKKKSTAGFKALLSEIQKQQQQQEETTSSGVSSPSPSQSSLSTKKKKKKIMK